MTQAVIAPVLTKKKEPSNFHHVQFVTKERVGHARIRLDTKGQDVAVCDECAVCKTFLGAGWSRPVLRWPQYMAFNPS
jgi:hypothetical protein